MLRLIFPMNLSISTLQSKSVQVSRRFIQLIKNGHVFFPKDENVSVETGNREPPQGNVTVCTEMNAPENSLFHCQRNWTLDRELIYINLTEVGTIKAVSIYTQGNRQVKT
jgi:hypothetical protein